MEQNHNPLYPAINRVSEKLPPQERLVFDCMVELCGLPDANFGVKIADDTGKRMKEAKHSRELAENEFFIDYTHGYAHFHRKMEGRVVTIEEMYSRGLLYYPASRIYMGGCPPSAETTLEGVLGGIQAAFEERPPVYFGEAAPDTEAEEYVWVRVLPGNGKEEAWRQKN